MSDAGDPAPEPSFERIEAGDIPLSAERRLSELRESGGSYTSDLSIADLALCRQVGLRPLSQVMGSSIYQVGYQESGAGMGYGWGLQLGGGLVTEMSTISEAWNDARDRALHRLAREAQEVGADAVVGVQIRAGGKDSATSMAAGAIEYSLLGTAVRREPARSSEPVLTELTVADYSKLVGAGIEPAGIVAWSSVFYANYASSTEEPPVSDADTEYDPTSLEGVPEAGRVRLEQNRAGLFTSDLSVNEFLLVKQAGFEPLGLVVGSSIYHIGLQLAGWKKSQELAVLSQAMYDARELAMERMQSEAQEIKAEGIVGVDLQEKSHGWGSHTIEFFAVGTAIVPSEGHDGTIEPPTPVLDLS
jgi:uncharacterized protein YbjQ (UPF0145 family)